MTGPAVSESRTASTLRRGLLVLALLSVLGIGYELFAEQHWATAVQLVAWALLAVLALAVLLACSARRPAIAAARTLAVVTLLGSAFGVYQHVAANYISGELDAGYADSWANRPTGEKMFLAVTKAVGANPPLAPGALGQGGLLVLLSTVGRGTRRPSA